MRMNDFSMIRLSDFESVCVKNTGREAIGFEPFRMKMSIFFAGAVTVALEHIEIIFSA